MGYDVILKAQQQNCNRHKDSSSILVTFVDKLKDPCMGCAVDSDSEILNVSFYKPPGTTNIMKYMEPQKWF